MKSAKAVSPFDDALAGRGEVILVATSRGVEVTVPEKQRE